MVASAAADNAGPLNVSVTTGSDIVCVITNTRETGKLEVKKNLSPTTDPGKFDLQIDGTTDANANDVGHNGSTGEETLNTGTHTVGEAAGASTDLADYQKSIECRADNGTGAVVASAAPDNAGPLNVSVTTGSDIVCVITNTRETGKLEVQKDLEPEHRHRALQPADRRQLTERRIAERRRRRHDRRADTQHRRPHGRQRPPWSEPTWPTTRSRSSARPTTAPAPPSPSTTTDDAGPLTVPVTTGSDIVCVITNTRETGKLEVKKDLEPDTDPGKFNLQIDGTTDPDAVNVGDGGSTGEQVLNTGNHTVGETAGTGTSLANYLKSIVCKSDNGTGTVVASSYGTTALTVPVTDGSDIVCTITNRRKTGKLEVVKKVNPTTDPGRFDLRIDDTVQKDEAAHNGTTDEKTLNTGNHTVAETADGETTLTDYSSSIECKADNGTGAVVAQGSGSGPVTVNVTYASDIVCTITNTRKTGKLEVVKKVNPTTDPGRFDLRIDNMVQKDEAAHNGTTDEKTLNTGNHTVAETADGETTLTDYSSSIECKADNGTGAVVAQGSGSGPVTVNVTDGSDIVCTITNQRKPEIKVVKDLVPNTDPGRFDLKIDTTPFTNGGAGYADGDTGFQKVTTGSHTVSEVGHGTTNLNDYVSKVVCDSSKGSTDPGTSRTFSVDYGDKVTCTITNQRKPEIKVVKDLVPNTDPGRFDLKIDTTPFTNGGAGYADGDTGFQKVTTGSHTVSEVGHGTTNLNDYVSKVVCDSGKGYDRSRHVAHLQRRLRRQGDLHDHEHAQAEADRHEGVSERQAEPRGSLPGRAQRDPQGHPGLRSERGLRPGGRGDGERQRAGPAREHHDEPGQLRDDIQLELRESDSDGTPGSRRAPHVHDHERAADPVPAVHPRILEEPPGPEGHLAACPARELLGRTGMGERHLRRDELR